MKEIERKKLKNLLRVLIVTVHVMVTDHSDIECNLSEDVAHEESVSSNPTVQVSDTMEVDSTECSSYLKDDNDIKTNSLLRRLLFLYFLLTDLCLTMMACCSTQVCLVTETSCMYLQV